VAPLEMAKHPQFKIIKKKMHKRPKKVLPGVLALLLAFNHFPASLILCFFLSSGTLFLSSFPSPPPSSLLVLAPRSLPQPRRATHQIAIAEGTRPTPWTNGT
jgi:hypothetical protein